MKTTVETRSEPKEEEFPRLMQHKHRGVILVISRNERGDFTGVVVSGDDVGHYYEDWFASKMTPFHGKVVLES